VSPDCDRIGSSTQYGLNGKLHPDDYLRVQARSKIGKFRRDYAAKNIAVVSAILSVAYMSLSRVTLNDYVSYGCCPTCRRLYISISLGSKRTL